MPEAIHFAHVSGRDEAVYVILSQVVHELGKLILGNDLTNMSEETLAIITNRDVIAIDQDPLGI